MKLEDAIRTLMREDDETVDIQAPPSQDVQRGKPEEPDFQGSSLFQSYQQRAWKRLVLFRDGILWEVEPVDGGRNFRFYELRMRRVGDPIEAENASELKNIEKHFDLEHGVENAPHITVVR